MRSADCPGATLCMAIYPFLHSADCSTLMREERKGAAVARERLQQLRGRAGSRGAASVLALRGRGCLPRHGCSAHASMRPPTTFPKRSRRAFKRRMGAAMRHLRVVCAKEWRRWTPAGLLIPAKQTIFNITILTQIYHLHRKKIDLPYFDVVCVSQSIDEVRPPARCCAPHRSVRSEIGCCAHRSCAEASWTYSGVLLLGCGGRVALAAVAAAHAVAKWLPLPAPQSVEADLAPHPYPCGRSACPHPTPPHTRLLDLPQLPNLLFTWLQHLFH